MNSNRILLGESGGRARTIWVICPVAGDNVPKGTLKPNVVGDGIVALPKGGTARPPATGWARRSSASWWGNGLPRQ